MGQEVGNRKMESLSNLPTTVLGWILYITKGRREDRVVFHRQKMETLIQLKAPAPLWQNEEFSIKLYQDGQAFLKTVKGLDGLEDIPLKGEPVKVKKDALTYWLFFIEGRKPTIFYSFSRFGTYLKVAQ